MFKLNHAWQMSLLMVASMSCRSAHDPGDSFGAGAFELAGSVQLSVTRREPSADVTLDEVGYSLFLTPFDWLPPWCDLPCKDDWERLDNMRNFPPLQLTLAATNESVAAPNTRTSYTGTIACSTPAWGQGNNELEDIDVSGDFALAEGNDTQIVLRCPNVNSGPVEANLTLSHYTEG